MTNAGRLPIASVRQFIGLSRMTHSILDIAHPAVGALFVLGCYPQTSTLLLGLGAAFAGFTAVFALNDIMDYHVDSEKMAKYRDSRAAFDLDSVGLRHPIAQGSLSYLTAIGWAIFWGGLSFALAFLLKPFCAALLLAAIMLEIGYCKLLRVTHWKVILSGCMVAIGGLAGVYAVSNDPALGSVALFFFWAFTWEVGGRNIPNDWSDLDEDVHLGIKTIPVRFGRVASSRASFSLLFIAVISSLLFPLIAPIKHPLVYLVCAIGVGAFLLLLPALRWLRSGTTESALYLFNRACFYPLGVFTILAVLMVI